MDFPFVLPFIRWADTSIVRPGLPTSLRRLYDHELVYVLGGSGTITIERHKYLAREDHLFLIPPRVWHSFVADQNCEFPLMGVHFDWAPQDDAFDFSAFRAAEEPVDESLFRLYQAVPHWNLHTQPVLDLKGRPRVRRLLEDVVVEYWRDSSMSRVASGALLAALLAEISHEAQLQTRRNADLCVSAHALRRVEKARQIVESSPHLSVDEVAARVGWSSDHLRKMFRAILGTNPTRLQLQSRLRRARDLLREGRLPIAEVGRECGFDDPSHFARTFRKDAGLTPRQYAMLARRT